MSNKEFLVLIFIVITKSYGFSFNECNRTHPDYDDSSCRKLWKPENRLHKFLLKNYNRDIRPTTRDNTASVKVDLLLKEISNIDASQKITAHVWLQLTWNDEFLRWYPSNFNHQSNIRLSKHSIWTPDITLFNGIAASKEGSFDLDVNSNGNVTWLVPKDLIANCDLNLRHFPYDNQNCSFIFGSWVYSNLELDLQSFQERVNIVNFNEKHEWSIESTNVVKETSINENKLVYPTIKFTLNLTRNYLNYTLLVTLPIAILSIFSILIFLLPVNSCATRLGFSLSILAGFFIIALYIQTRITGFSDSLSFLSIYCFLMVLVLTVAIFFIAIVANFNASTGQLPNILRTTLCKSCINNEEENEWKSISMCLNRFLFFFFLVLISLLVSVFILLFVAL